MSTLTEQELDALVAQVAGYRAVLTAHPDIVDQELVLPGTDDTFGLLDAINDLIDHASRMADAIADLRTERDETRSRFARAIHAGNVACDIADTKDAKIKLLEAEIATIRKRGEG